MIILQSDRLILRTSKIEDANTLHREIFSNKNVVKNTFGKELFNLQETKAFIKNSCYLDSKLGLNTLVEKESGEIIGLAGVLKCSYLGQVDYEFGFILAETYWGKGYASEIGKAQIDFVKNELKEKRVLALVHKENVSSLKCIQRLNLHFIKTVSTKDRGDREVYIKEL
ncbi:GNAT family N-acetyltransferase [Sulfurimonas sp.]|uniref:GNAT family N-acetyltransferase n=1 Tax=Sulfurimonas sp. TaxID=2022749 RepID=UPI0025E22EBB|nr:GNAT family N-acetyltransferase [Sulfurimonas sp.]